MAKLMAKETDQWKRIESMGRDPRTCENLEYLKYKSGIGKHWGSDDLFNKWC